MPKYLFPKSRRLLKSAEFDAVFAAKCSAADRLLVVYAWPNDKGHPRLGLVVSRKVGGAVRRNRWKRLLREAFRLAQHDLPAVDVVCLPRFRGEPTLDALAQALQELATRLAKKAERRLGEAAERRLGETADKQQKAERRQGEASS